MVFAIPIGPAIAGSTRSIDPRRRLKRVAQSALSAELDDHYRPFEPPHRDDATPLAPPVEDLDRSSDFETAILAGASSPEAKAGPDLAGRFKAFEPTMGTQARLKDILA